MKKIRNVFLLLLCGSFFFICALGSSSSSSKYESDSQPNNSAEITKVSFAEEKIYEGNNVIIYVTGSENTSLGTKINFRIENNSQLNLNFNVHLSGVNGVMYGSNIYDMRTEVAAGKKANNSLEIKNSFLKEYSMDKIKYLEILFWAYDNDKMFKSFETGVIKIKSDKFEDSNSWIKGTEIYNSSGIRVDFLSFEKDKAKYLVTNTTGNKIAISFEGISINDYTVSDTDYDLFDELLLDNTQKVFEISIDKDFKEKNSIQEVNKIEFYLKYSESETAIFASNKTGVITTNINK